MSINPPWLFYPMSKVLPFPTDRLLNSEQNDEAINFRMMFILLRYFSFWRSQRSFEMCVLMIENWFCMVFFTWHFSNSFLKLEKNYLLYGAWLHSTNTIYILCILCIHIDVYSVYIIIRCVYICIRYNYLFYFYFNF